MKKWIRGWGLSVFIISALLLVGSTVLFADFLVKRSVESVGSSVNGAKVELASARLSFDPMGFTLANLQITDAREPMRNAVQIDRIKFGVEGLPLLRRKVVITDLNAEGVRFNTQRTVSGALPETAGQELQAPIPETFANFALPNVDFPNNRDILAKENLLSTQLAAQLRTELDQAKTRWSRRVAELPDNAAIRSYNAQLKPTKSNFKGQPQDLQYLAERIKGLEALRDVVRNDVARIQSAQQLWDTDSDGWTQQTKQLMAAPGVDIQHLNMKYSLDAKGYANISRALFGSQVAQWIDTGLQWYGKLEPILENRVAQQPPEVVHGKGLDVKFLEFDALPDFLIRSAKLSVEIPLGLMTGEIRNVTNDQATLGHPMTFNFFADKMPGLDDLEIEGTFNHIKPQTAVDNILFKAHGVRIARHQLMELLQNSAAQVMLSDASVDVESSATLTGDALAAQMNVEFKTVKLGADAKNPESGLAKVMATALAEVKKFTITSKLRGTVKAYDLDLHSDLDELLRTALNRQFRQRADKFLADAILVIDEKVRSAIQQNEVNLSALKYYQTQIEQRRKQGEAVVQKIEQELRVAQGRQKNTLDLQRNAAKAPLKQKMQEAAGKKIGKFNSDLIAQ